MRRGLLAAVRAAALTLALAAPGSAADQGTAATLAGRYLVDGEVTKGERGDGPSVLIVPLASGVYHVIGREWEGVGLFDGVGYWGAFRYRPSARAAGLAGATGTHRASLGTDGSLTVHGEFSSGRTGSFDVVWRPEQKTTTPVRVTPPQPGEPDASKEYVYVEEIPEAVTRVPASYPDAARAARIQGTVMIQVLVGKDGLVKEARIVKGIPGLDEAALEAVRRWVFKPALSKGEPVEVWVAVPVKFSLH